MPQEVHISMNMSLNITEWEKMCEQEVPLQKEMKKKWTSKQYRNGNYMYFTIQWDKMNPILWVIINGNAYSALKRVE